MAIRRPTTDKLANQPHIYSPYHSNRRGAASPPAHNFSQRGWQPSWSLTVTSKANVRNEGQMEAFRYQWTTVFWHSQRTSSWWITSSPHTLGDNQTKQCDFQHYFLVNRYPCADLAVNQDGSSYRLGMVTHIQVWRCGWLCLDHYRKSRVYWVDVRAEDGTETGDNASMHRLSVHGTKATWVQSASLPSAS